MDAARMWLSCIGEWCARRVLPNCAGLNLVDVPELACPINKCIQSLIDRSVGQVLLDVLQNALSPDTVPQQVRLTRSRHQLWRSFADEQRAH